jgi:hypothetical protein
MRALPAAVGARVTAAATRSVSPAADRPLHALLTRWATGHAQSRLLFLRGMGIVFPTATSGGIPPGVRDIVGEGGGVAFDPHPTDPHMTPYHRVSFKPYALNPIPLAPEP